MFQSVIVGAGPVTFPDFNSERHYMVPFFKAEGLPKPLEHWQKTVDQMLEGIETELPIYFMADQSFVRRGETHRRGGIHIDGYWNPGVQAHGGHMPNRSGWSPSPARHVPEPTHGPVPMPRHFAGEVRWSDADFSYPEALILASDVLGCAAYEGEYDGVIGDGGDCSSVDLKGVRRRLLGPHRAYHATVSTLHESIPLPRDSYRTVVRLNVPGVSIQ